jgi:hypothetical protein
VNVELFGAVLADATGNTEGNGNVSRKKFTK